MMNKSILFIMVVMMIGLVGAIEEGDRFNQDQLNNFNSDNINVQFLQCQKIEYAQVHGWSVVTKYSCLDFYYIPDIDMYEVYRETYGFSISVWDAIDCFVSYGRDTCMNYHYNNIALPHLQNTIEGIRQKVIFYQQFGGNWLGDNDLW